jgi:predicted transcriptional regulator
MKVGDVMTREVVGVAPSDSLKQAGRLLVAHRISGFPVVDDSGRVVGVLSEADLLPKEVAPLPVGRGRVPHGEWQKLDAVVVGEAMSSPALTIEEDRPVAAAARMLIEEGVKRLPVVRDGRLVGIVSRHDLIRAFVRTDDEVAVDTRNEATRLLGSDANSVTAAVDDGVVTLDGRVDNRPDAEILELVVSRIPGVVAVHSHVGWYDADVES